MSHRGPAAYSAAIIETVPSSPLRWLAITTAVLALLGIGLGSAVALAPFAVLLGVGGLLLAIVSLFAMTGLPLWQKLAAVALAGFVILNYGFANWTLLNGVPIPLGHVLLLAALAVAIRGRGRVVRAFLKEPAVVWWMFLVGVSVAHLVLDIPRYGVWAIRDASFALEGLFLLLGFLWSQPASQVQSIFRVLAVVFLLNTLYALTAPIGQTVQALSPVSGLFQQVALLGAYAHTSLFLVAGGLFYFLAGPQMAPWPRGLVIGLAGLQICWSFVFQDRSMYVGIVVALTMLVLLRGVRVGGRMAVVVMASLAVFFLAIGVSGITLQGRLGEVGSDFFSQHVRSLFLDPNAPGAGSVEWRLGLLRQMWGRFTASAAVIVIGEGFGESLTDYKNAAQAVARQPHNTHITVLLRLGTLGLALWLAMHWRMLRALVQFLRHGRQAAFGRDLALWFLLFYVLAILMTTVQPWLEFSYGAIPFYLIMGMALGMSRHARTLPRERLVHGDSGT